MTNDRARTTEPERFIKKYFEHPEGRKEWCVTGDLGSVSFWVQDASEVSHMLGTDKYGGVETHYNAKSKPDYLGDGAYHKTCLQNGGECWHDGTPLWASEHWIPHILPFGNEAIWEELIRAYHNYMKKMKTQY